MHSELNIYQLTSSSILVEPTLTGACSLPDSARMSAREVSADVRDGGAQSLSQVARDLPPAADPPGAGGAAENLRSVEDGYRCWWWWEDGTPLLLVVVGGRDTAADGGGRTGHRCCWWWEDGTPLLLLLVGGRDTAAGGGRTGHRCW